MLYDHVHYFDNQNLVILLLNIVPYPRPYSCSIAVFLITSKSTSKFSISRTLFSQYYSFHMQSNTFLLNRDLLDTIIPLFTSLHFGVSRRRLCGTFLSMIEKSCSTPLIPQKIS